jgi:DNA-directed RNA polymerase specialized sigma24 family protein
MVERLAAAADQHDDLAQDAFLHLWLTEIQFPDRPLNWYYRACHFHIRHQLGRGRSLDSFKRRHLRCATEPSPFETEPTDKEVAVVHETPLHYSCARDLLEQLASRLEHPARTVLGLLVAEYGVREIAELVGLSPAMVVRHRQCIAETAGRLGVHH